MIGGPDPIEIFGHNFITCIQKSCICKSKIHFANKRKNAIKFYQFFRAKINSNENSN